MQGTGEVKESSSQKDEVRTVVPEVVPPSGHDIYTDPAIARALKEDPVFEWLKRYWRQIVVVGLTVGVAFYARDVFHRNYVVEMQRASEIFSRVRGGYEQLEANVAAVKVAEKSVETAEAALKAEKAAPEEKIKAVDTAKKNLTEAQAKVAESKKLMGHYLQALGDTREPYGTLQPVYRALVDRFDAAPETLAKLSAGLGALPADLGTVQGDARFVAEIKELAAIRLLIDVPNERGNVRKRLTTLVQSGRYVATSAALTLARLSTTSDDQAAAFRVISDFVSGNPEQSELLKDELARLGGKVTG